MPYLLLDQSPQSACKCVLGLMLATYVADCGWTGKATGSSTRVFQGLSAGKMVQPPIVGTLYVAKFWAGAAERLTVTIVKPD